MQTSPVTHPSGDWFKPTIGRFIFAALLAIAGFLLPQEVPLEWYPLNEPGNDINYLEISCAADKTGEVIIHYNLTHGINELNSIRFPISPTAQTYTYTFPLPDAPITDLRLDPLSAGGSLTIRQMRIIDRRGTEMRRFTRDMFTSLGEIASISPLPDGWRITSEANSTKPSTHIQMDAPILAKDITPRNILRCLYSASYLALMLWVLLLAVLFTFYRPGSWHDAIKHLGFMAVLATFFSAVGNRGLIKNSMRYACYSSPTVAPGAQLEIDLRISQPLAAQLFWNVGRDINEADSIRRNYETHTGLQTLRLPLPLGPFIGLRFDPLDGESQVVIRSLRIVDTARRTLLVLPLSALEPQHDIAQCVIAEDKLTIETTVGTKDPILNFTPSAVAIVNQTLEKQNKP